MPIPRKKPPKKIAAKKKAQREEEQAGTPLDFFGLPYLREGESEDILRETELVTITLPLNQFYLLWEVTEAFNKKNAKYEGMGNKLSFFADSWSAMSSLFRERFYGSSIGFGYFTRELGRYRLREAEKAEAAKKGRKAVKAAPDAPKTAERATAGSPEKKKRCTAEKKGVRCLGPLGHKGKRHKGKLKNGRKVTWVE